MDWESGNTDICPRCIKTIYKSQLNTTGCLNYYRKMCKSLNCQVHSKHSCTHKNRSKATLKDKLVTSIEEKQYSESSTVNYEEPFEVAEFDGESEPDIESKLFSQIERTMENVSDKYDKGISLNAVANNELFKDIIQKTIIWPLKKPKIFKGLRRPPRGVLLFGPPGTGKTFLVKCIASEANSTFFNIPASSIVSKYVGESEKLVKTMFLVAKARQPSIIFIDEVDSFLSKRLPDESASSRRIKNEFFIHMDGSSTEEDDRVMVIGSTNRPKELDEAARRRFFKRIYIPLPTEIERKGIIAQLIKDECHSLEEFDVNEIGKRTEGYSIADLKNLSQEAAMGPIKSLTQDAVLRLKPEKIRPINIGDFICALKLIKPTVSAEDVRDCEEWNSMYGYGTDNQIRATENYEKACENEKKTLLNNTYII